MFDDSGLSMMGDEISQLVDAAEAVGTYGVTPSAIAMLKITGLLAGTSLDAIAVEAFDGAPEQGDEADMAMESLLDKIKEKTTEWSTRILHTFKKGYEAILSVLEPIWNKVSTAVKTLSTKSWDKAKAAGRHLKAHPYQMAAVAVGGAVAAIGVIAFIASQVNGPYANESALQTFLYKVKDMVDKIRTPEGEITTTVAVHMPGPVGGPGSNPNVSYYEAPSKPAPGIRTRAYIKCTIDKVHSPVSNSKEMSTTVSESGWTQTGVKSISAQLSKVWDLLKRSLYTIGLNAAHFLDKGVSAVGSGLTSLGRGMFNAEAKIKQKTGSEFLSKMLPYAFLVALPHVIYAVLTLIVNLIHWVITSAFRMVEKAFSGLSAIFA